MNMCGIIGYSGTMNAAEILINGLEQLEYRGYDSAGIAVQTKEGKQVIKSVGNVSVLKEKIEKVGIASSVCGIGHTRWATHGGVVEENAHPHTFGKVTLIHNGIIENYKEILTEYKKKSASLKSQTDTEIAAMLFDSCYSREDSGSDPVKAIFQAVKRMEGSYAFCIMFEDKPEEVYCIRRVSPLVASCTEKGSFVASDVTALIAYSKDYFVVPENILMILKKEEICLVSESGAEVEPEMLHVDWDITAAQKNGYPHFMFKEIMEQPEALQNTIAPRIKDGCPDFETDGIPDSIFAETEKVVIAACGTAMHAGYIGKVWIEKKVRVPADVVVASEFRYQEPILDGKTLVILISQSGETIDTLASLRLAKEEGAKTLAIVNVKGSAIARESDYVLYTHAGPEIAVASTKAYTVQVASLCLLAMRFAFVKGRYTKEEIAYDFEQLRESVKGVSTSLAYSEEIKEISVCLKEKEDLFFIGRGIDFALSAEGSIKLKEISYIHSEAYAAGELKHGTISLITDGMPVIAIATQEHVFAKMISNIREVKARGALVILITKEGVILEEGVCDYHLTIPGMRDEFTPIPAAVLLQLIAYHSAVHRGLNVDQPRNLAKSVTVE